VDDDHPRERRARRLLDEPNLPLLQAVIGSDERSQVGRGRRQRLDLHSGELLFAQQALGSGSKGGRSGRDQALERPRGLGQAEAAQRLERLGGNLFADVLGQHEQQVHRARAGHGAQRPDHGDDGVGLLLIE
jgi:hypothetical protein